MLDKQEAGHVADEHLKDQMAAVHSQVWLNKLVFFVKNFSFVLNLSFSQSNDCTKSPN